MLCTVPFISDFPGQESGVAHLISANWPNAAQSSSVGFSPMKNCLSPVKGHKGCGHEILLTNVTHLIHESYVKAGFEI